MIGQHVILTGGTSGLGESLLEELISRGAHVTVIGRSKQKLNQLKALYENINTYTLDLTKPINSNHIYEVLLQYGSVDLLINNAGIGYFKSVENHEDEEIINIMSVNATHTMILTKTLIPLIRDGGSVVNVISQAARVSTPYGAIYAASKAALYSFSNSLRLEHPRLNVMTVSPGPIDTPFFDSADLTGRYRTSTKGIQLKSNDLALKIIQGVINRQLEINVPKWMHVSLTVYNLAPRTIERFFGKFFQSKNFNN